MTATVDKDTCIGCGMCTGIDPDDFEMGDDGLAEAKNPVTDEAVAKEAAESCPVSAITVE